MKLGFERSFVESEPGAEWLLEDLRALGDLCLPGGLGKAIPWTGVEAVVEIIIAVRALGAHVLRSRGIVLC